MASLTLNRITKRYGDTAAVNELSLEVADGELLAVLGPSGAGKSTLLRLITGLEHADSGSVEIDREDATSIPPDRRGVAMIFQSFALFPHLSAGENISFGLSVRGVEPGERSRRVEEVSARLGLTELLDRRPWALSGGERQRVALARGLVGRPRALLLDEPLSNLDTQLRTELRAELRRVQEELGLTVVHVTHDQAEALSLGDRVALMRDGRIEQCDAPHTLYERPASAWAAGFLGSPPMNLVRGEVIAGTVQADGLRLPLPPGAAPGGREVLAGVRPEHVRVSSARGEGIGEASVELDETTGHERLLHLRVGATVLIARLPAGPSQGRGERAWLAVSPEHVHLFDPDSGDAL